ncbi:hypothetical protein PENSPDRAFT_666014 [Peniophora sp. CONT]|nr:hypothetical protein PENSPDRAFT_666014 [Peniophora sp. CONT]
MEIEGWKSVDWMLRAMHVAVACTPKGLSERPRKRHPYRQNTGLRLPASSYAESEATVPNEKVQQTRYNQYLRKLRMRVVSRYRRTCANLHEKGASPTTPAGVITLYALPVLHKLYFNQARWSTGIDYPVLSCPPHILGLYMRVTVHIDRASRPYRTRIQPLIVETLVAAFAHQLNVGEEEKLTAQDQVGTALPARKVHIVEGVGFVYRSPEVYARRGRCVGVGPQLAAEKEAVVRVGMNAFASRCKRLLRLCRETVVANTDGCEEGATVTEARHLLAKMCACAVDDAGGTGAKAKRDNPEPSAVDRCGKARRARWWCRCTQKRRAKQRRRGTRLAEPQKSKECETAAELQLVESAGGSARPGAGGFGGFFAFGC